MEQIRTIAVDDEPLACKLISGYISKTPFLSLIGSFCSSVEALASIESGAADLVFMDIQMPDLSGMELARLVSGKAKIIFTTAFQQYAIEGYKVAALDYLLKPVSYSDFLAAASRARDIILAETGAGTEESASLKDSILLKIDGQLVKIPTAEILYIESQKDYIAVHTADGATYMSLVSMKKIDSLLPHDRFFRVQRSYIVALDKVKVIERNHIVFGRDRIAISDTCRDEFFSALSKFNIIL